MIKAHPKIYLLFFMRTIRSLWSATCKKKFRIPTFIGLTRVSTVNTNWRNHLHISNGVLLPVNISFVCQRASFLNILANCICVVCGILYKFCISSQVWIIIYDNIAQPYQYYRFVTNYIALTSNRSWGRSAQTSTITSKLLIFVKLHSELADPTKL